MFKQENTIKSYDEIMRTARGGPFLSLTQKSILTFILLLGILSGLLLADCWGNIPPIQEQLQVQTKKFNGQMFLFEKQQPLAPLGENIIKRHYQQKRMTKTGRTVAVQLRHKRLNETLRKRIQARKRLLRETRKGKVSRILFLVSISSPLNKP